MFKKIGVLVIGLLVAGSCSAAAPTTIAELTTGISFADVSLGILAVAGLLTAVYVVWRGAQMIIYALEVRREDQDAFEEWEDRNNGHT